ncbi:MAG: non-canonical purine NTP pyrophosphatase [Deltaproteobacteria bacterium]|nr:non-canonical purine NTP pyrophosphatase [Deltaproteobacteria bacterium]
MRLTNKIILASTNNHKLKEFQAIWKAYPEFEIIPVHEFIRNTEKLSFVETHNTFLDNAIAKSRLVSQCSHQVALGDDSGLEVDALAGKPGVHSFRYAKPPMGHAPYSRQEQDWANIELLLHELKPKHKPWKANFKCALALTIEGIMMLSEETLDGEIIETPHGNNGFGYDPVFIPHGFQKTLAEMADKEKNTISHRAKAVYQLISKIKECTIVFAKP